MSQRIGGVSSEGLNQGMTYDKKRITDIGVVTDEKSGNKCGTASQK
ncbi:MAG TPA: hypothetical protein VK543_08545 [Puia sp.]|nr:hypothetical protein [Puia sp.]